MVAPASSAELASERARDEIGVINVFTLVLGQAPNVGRLLTQVSGLVSNLLSTLNVPSGIL